MLTRVKATAEIYSKELSELALDAAIESEDLISGKAQTSEAINLFVKRIQQSIVAKNGNKSLSDVTLMPIYYRALTSTTGQQIDDTRTLIETLGQVLKEVKVDKGNTLNTPAHFRDFCLAMYNALVSTAITDRDKTFNPSLR